MITLNMISYPPIHGSQLTFAKKTILPFVLNVNHKSTYGSGSGVHSHLVPLNRLPEAPTFISVHSSSYVTPDNV
uniref:Ovule protein n=1 Tax=Steinernema glaseri TaxID=37863 RepID=A0A1I7Z662_9BILA